MKNGGAPGTHCLCMRLISPRCGDSGLFLILPCYVTPEFGLDIYNILVRILNVMACNESSDCSIATDLLNFVRSIIAASKLSTLSLDFAHLRFGKMSSSFNIISNRVLILDASLSWLAFLKQCYSMVTISRKGGKLIPLSLTGSHGSVYYL